jgi:sulfate adenylyltransferase subunit 1 (EFTu-like GTPase family)
MSRVSLNISLLNGHSSSKTERNFLKYLLNEFNSDNTFDEDINSGIWNFKIKNRLVNIEYHSDTSVSRSDILFLYLSKDICKLTKMKLLIANILGIKNIVVFVPTLELTELKKLLVKRNFKSNKIECIYMNDDNGFKDLLNKNKLVDYLKNFKLLGSTNRELIVPVSNVFDIDKKHIAINGRVLSGKLNVNDIITINPGHISTKVLEIQKDHHTITTANTGDNIGILIKKIKSEIDQGMVISNDTLEPIHFIQSKVIVIHPTEGIEKGMVCDFIGTHIYSKCKIEKLIKTVDIMDKSICKNPEFISYGSSAIMTIALRKSIVAKKYSTNHKLGSFYLRKEDSDEIIGVGIIKSCH